MAGLPVQGHAMLPPIKLSSRASGEFWEIQVLHEDGDLLALDKPAGLATSPDRYDPERTNLVRLLHDGIKRGVPWASARGFGYLANAHRLDPDTSGVLLLAKTRPALVALADQFGSGRSRETYVALVQGGPRSDEFEVDAKLGPHPHRPGAVRVDSKGGKPAKTQFAVVERFRGYSLLRCQPLTRRPHQIRAHLESVGLPLAADQVYGGRPILLSRLKRDYVFKRDEPERPLMGRVALHAEALTVAHPTAGTPVTITSPWPKDLQVALKYLRRYAPLGRAPAADHHVDSDRGGRLRRS